MRKKLLWFGLGLLILGVLAFTFNAVYEIVEDEKPFPPSREARVNEYLALDRWLVSEGHSIRILTAGSLDTLKAAEETTLFIQSDLFDWNTETTGYLESWVEKGGSLILCLTFYRSWHEDDELGAFLIRMGIESGEEPDTYTYNTEYPSFGRNVHFKEIEDEAALILKDSSGLVRLMQFPRGGGKITVTGRPRFMTSFNLSYEPNARLSWYLLAGGDSPAARGETEDILFIRGYVPHQGLMGQVLERGNFFIIIISAAALIIAGFWSVIPVFGIVRRSEEKPGKALAERFLAEGRFLKRFRALDHYRAVYIREIRRRLMKQNMNDGELVKQMEASQNNKKFLESVVTLKNILERL